MKKVLSVLFIMSVALCFVFAGGKSETTGANPRSGQDTFTWSGPISVTTLNWAESSGNTGSIVISYVTNFLVDRYFTADGGVATGICPKGLAESYKYDNDSMGITFYLKKNVTFQNGMKFKAADVLLSVKFFASKTGYEFIDFAKMRAIDDYTVYIPFKKLDGSALTKFSVIPMWSAEYYASLNGDENKFFREKVIGTGPFKVTKWVDDDHIYTERYDGYYEGAAKLKHINFRIITENNVALAELQTGGIDYIMRANGNDVSDVEAGLYGKDIAVGKDKNEDSLLMHFNMSKKRWENLKLKQAICTAIDRTSIVTAAFGEGGEECWTVMSDRTGKLTKYEGDKWFYPYNVEKAKALLAEAGYRDRDGDGYVEDESGKRMVLEYCIIGTQSIQTTTAEIVKNNLAKIGIDVNITGADVATWVNTLQNDLDAWDITNLNTGTIDSASGREYSFHDFPAGMNHCNMSSSYDDFYNNWVYPLSQILDEDEWLAKFRGLEPLLMTKYLYFYPLDQTRDISFYASNLKGFEKISWSTWYVKDAYFE